MVSVVSKWTLLCSGPFHIFACLPCVVLTTVLLCTFWLDPIFNLKVEEKNVLMEALQQPWQVQEKAMETDVSALQSVEDLEQRVVVADLLLKVRNHLTFCQINYINLMMLKHYKSSRVDKVKLKVWLL